MMHSAFHPLFGILHAMSVLAFAIGVLLLVIWAIRHLSAQKLKSMAFWLIGIGIAGCILTIALLQLGAGRSRGPGMMYRGGELKEGRGMMRDQGMMNDWEVQDEEQTLSSSSQSSR